METFLYLALIVLSLVLVVAVILQSKGTTGGLFLSDYGSIIPARRGLEKTLFQITVVLSVLFFLLVILTTRVLG